MPPLVLTADEKRLALESGGADLKFLLGKEEIDEEAQAILYHVGVKTVSRFASFAKDGEDLKKVLKDDFGLDQATDIRQRGQVAAILCAFQNAQARTTKHAEVDAEMETRQWTKVVPSSDYIAMRMAFEKKFWKLEDRETPSKDYLEKLLEFLENGELTAEALTEVVSKDEIEPDTLQPVWDKTGRLTVKKGSSSVPLPSNPEELRRRLSIMAHAYIMLGLRRSNRPELQGINPGLFEKYKTYILGDYVLGLQSKDTMGEVISRPPWHLVISYEHAIRKKMMKLLNDTSTAFSFSDALKFSWNDPTTKERHFTTPLALVVHRRPQPQEARSPRKGDTSSKGPYKGNLKGGGKGKDKGGKGKRSSKTPDGKAICFRYNNQKEKCRNKKCNFEHCCSICFGKHPSYSCDGPKHPDTTGDGS